MCRSEVAGRSRYLLFTTKQMPLRLTEFALCLLLTTLLSALRVEAQGTAAPPGGRVLEIDTLERSADPCTDIDQFANGTWLKNNPIPADRSRWDAYSELGDRTLGRLRDLAEAAAQDTTAPPGSPARLVGDYYRSGMEEAKIEAAGITPLREELDKIDALSRRDQVQEIIAGHHLLGVDPLFGLVIDQDPKHSSRYIAQLWQGGLGLPDRDYYLKPDQKTRAIRAAYVLHVARMFELLGEPQAKARLSAQIVMAMETRLARASMTKVELRDPRRVYHLMQLSQLNSLTPKLRWNNYFSAINLRNPRDLNVAQPEFFREAGRLLQSAPLEHWKIYLRWHLLTSAADHLSSAFVDEDFHFKGQILAGTKELQPRWKRVLTSVDHNIGEALGQLYVEKYFSPEAKAKALQMVANLKSAMRENLQTLAWMSPATKKKAIEKLDRMQVKIGYPNQWRDYSVLSIDRESYLGNTLNANRFEFRRNLAKLGKPIDRSEWGMTPPTVNAYYNSTMNEMVFPAGVLQPPLFDVDADDASNYGNTGATIGHELTHGFDDEGRQYDAEGNLKNWWTAQDEKNFLARSKMIEKQFDEFVPIDGIHINGKLTAGENIADLGGLKIALRALHKALEGKQPEPIDGFTPEQRFFIAYAQSSRENIRPEKLRLQLATDPHAPSKYRILGPIANLPEFLTAFNCPAERSPLRADSLRVNIW
jgi:putative endopeptidase